MISFAAKVAFKRERRRNSLDENRSTNVERSKAERKGIVCVPVWQRIWGASWRRGYGLVPRYTKFLCSLAITSQDRGSVIARVSRSPSDRDRCVSLNCLILK